MSRKKIEQFDSKVFTVYIFPYRELLEIKNDCNFAIEFYVKAELFTFDYKMHFDSPFQSPHRFILFYIFFAHTHSKSFT